MNFTKHLKNSICASQIPKHSRKRTLFITFSPGMSGVDCLILKQSLKMVFKELEARARRKWGKFTKEQDMRSEQNWAEHHRSRYNFP